MFLNFVEEEKLKDFLNRYFDDVKFVDRSHIKVKKFRQSILLASFNTSSEETRRLELFIEKDNNLLINRGSIELGLNNSGSIIILNDNLILFDTEDEELNITVKFDIVLNEEVIALFKDKFIDTLIKIKPDFKLYNYDIRVDDTSIDLTIMIDAVPGDTPTLLKKLDGNTSFFKESINNFIMSNRLHKYYNKFTVQTVELACLENRKKITLENTNNTSIHEFIQAEIKNIKLDFKEYVVEGDRGYDDDQFECIEVDFINHHLQIDCRLRKHEFVSEYVSFVYYLNEIYSLDDINNIDKDAFYVSTQSSIDDDTEKYYRKDDQSYAKKWEIIPITVLRQVIKHFHDNV